MIFKNRLYLLTILALPILANGMISCSITHPSTVTTLTPIIPKPSNTSMPSSAATPAPPPIFTTMPTPVKIIFSMLVPITIENAGNLSQISELHQEIAVKELAFSPDGNFLFVGCTDDNNEALVNIWNIASGSLVHTINMGSRFLDDLSISSDGTKLAVASSVDGINIWNISTYENFVIPEQEIEAPFISVNFDPTGEVLAYGNAMIGSLGAWDLEADRLLFEVQADAHDVTSISFTPDGQKVISGGWEGIVRIWNTKTGVLVKDIDIQSDPKTTGDTSYVDTYSIKQILISAKGQMAVAGCAQECIVQIRDINSGDLIQQLMINTASRDLYKHAIAFNPDGTILGIGSCSEFSSNGLCTKTEVTLTEMNSFTTINKLKNAGAIIAISPDGKLIATGAEDGSVHLFGVANP